MFSLSMVSSRTMRLLLHVAGWILFFGLMIAFTASANGGENFAARIFQPQYLFFYGVYIFLFYLNTELLIPDLYVKKHYFYYFTIIALLLVAIFFLKPFDHLLNDARPHFDRPPPDEDSFGPGPRHGGTRIDIVSIILFLMVWAVSTALLIIARWRETERRAARAETDKAQAELSFLKAQINPHFLFNTLNNIYALAISSSEKTADSIMKLSNIMRYVTDEVGLDFVPLRDELNFVKDYIDLQHMRLSSKVSVNYSVTGELENKNIAPLILMAFIENVFKYGISNHEESEIIIQINATRDAIEFYCRNKLFASERRAERTGIGITNSRKRLVHLYGGKYLLNISSEGGFFSVQLTIPVK